jgi:hypothetical protein
MRRSLFRLLTVVAVAGLLGPGCQVIQPTGALRVLSINAGNMLHSDLNDFYVFFNKEDSVWDTVWQYPGDSVKVEMQYVEIGAGLPTYTPYEAIVTQATVTFTSKVPADPADKPPYQKVTVPLTVVVPSDPTGKKITTFWMTPVPSSWKQLVFLDGGFITESPYELNNVDLAEAKVTFIGYDSVANRSVEASGTFQVEFGNFWDDPTRFGK